MKGVRSMEILGRAGRGDDVQPTAVIARSASDEAIQFFLVELDCFALLAMT